jgi:hypothetical protein
VFLEQAPFAVACPVLPFSAKAGQHFLAMHGKGIRLFPDFQKFYAPLFDSAHFCSL